MKIFRSYEEITAGVGINLFTYDLADGGYASPSTVVIPDFLEKTKLILKTYFRSIRALLSLPRRSIE